MPIQLWPEVRRWVTRLAGRNRRAAGVFLAGQTDCLQMPGQRRPRPKDQPPGGFSRKWPSGFLAPRSQTAAGLPAYSPELNPQEHVCDDLREKAFANRVTANMEEWIVGLKQGLEEVSADAQRLRRLTVWPWIVSLNWTVK